MVVFPAPPFCDTNATVNMDPRHVSMLPVL